MQAGRALRVAGLCISGRWRLSAASGGGMVAKPPSNGDKFRNRLRVGRGDQHGRED
ncbi:MAG TPA: hypothetical protein PKA35_01240 [Paracoccus solventivorans]|uniref:hypothetical protein n=1 Tax=Paracoccus solventivorans TaxID=53463 RepID=UPI002BDF4BB5|nr:hypothetical protein [Paracoccus solventivorans]HMM07725.1 hypothetical protein [Paracoccus solventivorans]